MTQFTEYASVGREMAALVLFSGGQDSTTCLGWALERFGRVETIGVDYGQRHQAELECRVRVREKMAQLKPQWGERLGDDHLLKLPVLGEIADCALTDERRIALKRQVCLIRSSQGEISSFLRLPLRSHIDGGFGCSWEACVRRTIRGIRTAATIRSKVFRLRSILDLICRLLLKRL